MKEKLYDLPIKNALTSARREALNQHIARNVHLSASPVRYEWDETGGQVLRITADPVTFEVRFHAKKVEIYGSAPLWARLLLTGKKKEQLKHEIQLILQIPVLSPSGRKIRSRCPERSGRDLNLGNVLALR
jgi:hypothetical protein